MSSNKKKDLNGYFYLTHGTFPGSMSLAAIDAADPGTKTWKGTHLPVRLWGPWLDPTDTDGSVGFKAKKSLELGEDFVLSGSYQYVYARASVVTNPPDPDLIRPFTHVLDESTDVELVVDDGTLASTYGEELVFFASPYVYFLLVKMKEVSGSEPECVIFNSEDLIFVPIKSEKCPVFTTLPNIQSSYYDVSITPIDNEDVNWDTNGGPCQFTVRLTHPEIKTALEQFKTGTADGQILSWRQTAPQGWVLSEPPVNTGDIPYWSASEYKYKFISAGTAGQVLAIPPGGGVPAFEDTGECP